MLTFLYCYMREDISIDNLELLQSLKEYFAKHILELSDAEKEMFSKIMERLKYATYE